MFQLTAIQNALETAKKIHLENEVGEALRPCLFFPLWFYFAINALGSKLPDHLMLMSIQEQNQNIIENQRQIQYQAKLQAQRTVLSGLITAPPSASVTVTSYLVFNALHLPSPPPSPDSEREEH